MKKTKMRGLTDAQLMAILSEHADTINNHARVLNQQRLVLEQLGRQIHALIHSPSAPPAEPESIADAVDVAHP